MPRQAMSHKFPIVMLEVVNAEFTFTIKEGQMCFTMAFTRNKQNNMRSPNSDLATGKTSEESWFESRQGYEICLFCNASRLAQGPTQPPGQRVPADVSPVQSDRGVKLTFHLNKFPRLKMS
jgi:hypothetical protein